MKKNSKNTVLFWLLVLVWMLPCSPAQAALKDSSTARAITSYTKWIKKAVKAGGNKTYSKAVLNNYNDLKAFRKILKRRLGDTSYAGRAYGTGRSFSSEKNAIIYMWSLSYSNGPYVDYSTICDRGQDGKWYGYIPDDEENTIKYQDDKGGYAKKAASLIKADFKKQRAAYEQKYGKMSQEELVAAITNYIAENMDYGEGLLYYGGDWYWAGGDLYTAYMTGVGDCVDYSDLFHLLCRANGIESHIVMGAVKEDAGDEATYHQWNLVKIRKRYFFIDPTWSDEGANTGRKLSRYYFGKSRKNLYYFSAIYTIA